MKNDQLKKMRAIWGALFLSQFLYLYVVMTISRSEEPSDVELFRNVFMGVSMIIVTLAVLLPKFMVSRARKKINRDQGTPELPELTRHYMVPFIVSLALFESVTLYGFVLGFIGHDPSAMYPFLAVGILGFLWRFPTEEKIRSAFQPS